MDNISDLGLDIYKTNWISLPSFELLLHLDPIGLEASQSNLVKKRVMMLVNPFMASRQTSGLKTLEKYCFLEIIPFGKLKWWMRKIRLEVTKGKRRKMGARS